MCSQDVDDGTFARREAYIYLSPYHCCSKFQEYENRICELKLYQEEVLERGRQLGLYPTDVSEFFS